MKFGYTQSHPHQNSIELRKTHSAFPIAIASPGGVRSCISTVTELKSNIHAYNNTYEISFCYT